MSINRMMNHPRPTGADVAFDCPCQAICDTDWVGDPANPLDTTRGPIQQGETVWVQAALFGSGPTWQPARLADQTPCYINPQHFK